MKILFIGDIVGAPGRKAVKGLLPVLIKEEAIDFVVANAENASGGSGVTFDAADELFKSGADVLTSGDHIWKRKETIDFLIREPRLLRPLNYPAGAPGEGFGVFRSRANKKIGIANLCGRVFMQPIECPFAAAKHAVESLLKETNIILVDIHAEATSEKIALGWYLDGKASCVLGTHTHVQTADERILPLGTAFLTDAGMTGPCDSVIGRKVEDVLERFITGVPVRFEVADSNIQLQGAIIEIDEATGRAKAINRIVRKLG